MAADVARHENLFIVAQGESRIQWRHGTVRHGENDFAITVLLQVILYTSFAFQ
jgi:hypothetical protein